MSSKVSHMHSKSAAARVSKGAPPTQHLKRREGFESALPATPEFCIRTPQLRRLGHKGGIRKFSGDWDVALRRVLMRVLRGVLVKCIAQTHYYKRTTVRTDFMKAAGAAQTGIYLAGVAQPNHRKKKIVGDV
jgi:histone H3/H4